MRTHKARLGGSTRSSSCASNPNVAHASLRGKQMPAKMTYSGVALNERGPSFRNPTPTIRKNSCNEPHGKRQSMQIHGATRKCSPWRQCRSNVTVRVHAIRLIHQPISRCRPRARTQCPRKKLPLAMPPETVRAWCAGVFLDSGQTRMIPGTQVWDVSFGQGAAPEARLPLRSSCVHSGYPSFTPTTPV
jgi:hypothetical protein